MEEMSEDRRGWCLDEISKDASRERGRNLRVKKDQGC